MSTPAATTQPAEVARARVGVLVATYQVDVVVPTRFTVETFIDDLLVVLAEAIDDESIDFTAPTGLWSLARPGEPPIPRWHVLADYDIADGALLMLSVVESAEEFKPVVEDITDALALTNEREFAEYDAETSAVTGMAVLGLGALTASVLLSWSWFRTGSFWWCGLPALLLGAAAALGAVSAGRRAGTTRPGLGLALSAVPLLFAGGAMLVPAPYGEPGPFGAANLAAGAVLAAVSAILLLRLTGWAVATMIATATLALVGTVAALTATYTNVAIRQLGGGALLIGLILLTFAPRLAVMLARIQPPDLPDPGNEVTPASLTDIFDNESGAEQGRSDTSPEPRLPSTGADIERRARYAVACLRGLIVAIAAQLAVAAVVVCVVSPGGVREIVVAAAVAAILVMRARWHPDRVQALALIGSAAAVVVGVGAVLAGAYSSSGARLLVALAVVVVAGAGCAAAVHLPGRRLTPVTRRLIDLLEYALIVLIPVLACWIAGIYTALRRI
ncbi:type VII secretion integral membrane protein EccD [Nocardia brasiliensis]|uniref:type VII secretion integral membrane protein EccD n=1 Tax=Nocardia brasiliensis TaxID=37326 RepID=UPI002454B79B|nr:type VII secretion integral membrane protein EccD [Nocardia brasiliensis]